MVEGSVSSHSSLDLEFGTIGKSVSVVLGSGLVNNPSLVQAIVAAPEDDVLIGFVFTLVNIKA
jgi:hypothetical protein